MPDNIIIVEINEHRSSIIRKLIYNEDQCLLTVYFRSYFTDHLTYSGVSRNHFDEFYRQKSVGKYYLHYIKPNFLLTKRESMSQEKKRMPTKNLASNQMRFIDMSLNVKDIVKAWIHAGEKGDYLNITLCMKPDGELDEYGNLGFVTQKVPTSIYKADKTAKGPILGNACEIDWEAFRAMNGVRDDIQPGQDTGKFAPEDDLPF